MYAYTKQPSIFLFTLNNSFLQVRIMGIAHHLQGETIFYFASCIEKMPIFVFEYIVLYCRYGPKMFNGLLIFSFSSVNEPALLSRIRVLVCWSQTIKKGRSYLILLTMSRSDILVLHFLP